MLKPIELRDTNNSVVLTGEIDIVDFTYPDIITWNNADYIVKAIYKSNGLGSYRQATVYKYNQPGQAQAPVAEQQQAAAPTEGSVVAEGF